MHDVKPCKVLMYSLWKYVILFISFQIELLYLCQGVNWIKDSTSKKNAKFTKPQKAQKFIEFFWNWLSCRIAQVSLQNCHQKSWYRTLGLAERRQRRGRSGWCHWRGFLLLARRVCKDMRYQLRAREDHYYSSQIQQNIWYFAAEMLRIELKLLKNYDT